MGLGCGQEGGIEIPNGDGGVVGVAASTSEALSYKRGESLTPIPRSKMKEIESAACDADDDTHQHGGPSVDAIIPIIDCVDKISDNKYVAHFSYQNPSGRVQHIPVGRSPANFFSPGVEDRGQPTTFIAGIKRDTFQITFNGDPVAWIVGMEAAVASRMMRRCTPPPVCPTCCDDGNPCTADSCNAATNFVCIHTPVLDGVSCSDGDVCNGAETCKAGLCRRGTPLKNGTSCDDGNKCNGSETCHDGCCKPGPKLNCNDHNPCTSDSCDKATGCKHTPVDDGTCCEGKGECGPATCLSGYCSPKFPTACDDGNPCTADLCEPDGSCGHFPIPDGVRVSDGNLCNGVETCKNGRPHRSPPVECAPADCCHTAGTCDPTTGKCVGAAPKDDGTPCDDGNVCTSNDSCQSGVCTGGDPLVCPNPRDLCDPTTGCPTCAG